MNKNEKAISELQKGIKNVIDRAIDIAPFNKIEIGRIVSSTNNGYNVLINKQIYKDIPIVGDSCFVNEIVKVIIPNNQYNNMFILKIDKSSSSGTVTSVNGKGGIVVLDKEDIGLSNVPNVSTNNQTPTWTIAGALSNLVSGETLTIAFGKISKAIVSLISHIANISNPHSVTKSQVGLSNVENVLQYSASNPQINVSGSSGSCNGNSVTATALTSSAGSLTQPIYFKNGLPEVGQYTLGNSCEKGVKTLSSWEGLDWIDQQDGDAYLISKSCLAFWDGSYLNNVSNLKYCFAGEFGSACTRSYTNTISSGNTSLPTSGAVYSALSSIGSYEEGIWTPSFYISSSSITSEYQKECKYKKIGNMIYIYACLIFTTPYSCYKISGLPFSADIGLDTSRSDLNIYRSNVNERNNIYYNGTNIVVNKGYSSSITSNSWSIEGWYYTYTS